MKKSLFLLLIMMKSLAFAGAVEWGVVVLDQISSRAYDIEIMLPFVGLGGVGVYSVDSTKVTTSSDQAICEDFSNVAGNCYSMLLQTSYGTPIDYDLFCFDPGKDLLWQWWNLYPSNVKDPCWIIPKTDPDFSNTVIIAFALSWAAGVEYVVQYYGWFELGYDGEHIFICRDGMGSAAAAAGTTLYAGVYGDSAIPEPSTALLALSGVALLLRRRRQKEKR